MPPDERSGPQVTTPESRRNARAAATATQPRPQPRERFNRMVTEPPGPHGAAGNPNDLDELRHLIAAAADLVDDLEGQRAAETAEFHAGYRLGFDAGHEVGYRQAEDDMAREWAVLAGKVRAIASQPTPQALQERREQLEVALPCQQPGGCDGWHVAHYRVDRGAVRCHRHQPVRWCPDHNANDRCRYLAWMRQTQRPEYTGGPVEWDTTRQTDRGTAA